MSRIDRLGGGGLNSNLSSISLYYWRGEYNLGDALNLELVERKTRINRGFSL